MYKSLYFIAFICIMIISGCTSNNDDKLVPFDQEITSDQSLPVASDALQQVSSTCKQTIDQLWTQRSHVSNDKQKIFYEMMGRASQNCNNLIEAYKSITTQYTNYQQSLKNAQECLGNSLPDHNAFKSDERNSIE